MVTFDRGAKPGEVKIYLDGKHVGKIKKVEGGHQYFPKGAKVGGEIFASFLACINSLS
jgi:hypothetical protein